MSGSLRRWSGGTRCTTHHEMKLPEVPDHDVGLIWAEQLWFSALLVLVAGGQNHAE